MTQDEIIEMAREAGIVVTGEAIYTLCKLVADKEREACAKRIEDLEAMLERQTARIVDLQTHIENFDGEDR